jgi:hypothetical protein
LIVHIAEEGAIEEAPLDPRGSSETTDTRAQQAIRVRQKVSKSLADAFSEVFKDARPRLLPIYDHRKVHLLLVQWDRLHKKLELVEVRPVQAYPDFGKC